MLLYCLLTGCDRADNTNYFDKSNEMSEEVSNNWIDGVIDKGKGYIEKGVGQIDLTEQATSLPKSVYDYNVEKDFPLKEDSTKVQKRTFNDYWSDMWITTENTAESLQENSTVEK